MEQDLFGPIEYSTHIKYCVTWTERRMIKDKYDHKDFYQNFEFLTDAKLLYAEVLKLENLYSANLCQIIKTTE